MLDKGASFRRNIVALESSIFGGSINRWVFHYARTSPFESILNFSSDSFFLSHSERRGRVRKGRSGASCIVSTTTLLESPGIDAMKFSSFFWPTSLPEMSLFCFFFRSSDSRIKRTKYFHISTKHFLSCSYFCQVYAEFKQLLLNMQSILQFSQNFDTTTEKLF